MPPPAPRRTNGTDLLIVGGGPAGCAAAVMAASLGMRSVLVEPEALCHRLRHIPAIDNVLGGHRTGPALADAITADVRRSGLCHLALGRRVTRVTASDDHVEATWSTGERTTAPYAVVATGVRPLRPADTDWITTPAGFPPPPPLWEADPAAVTGKHVLVLGADRPLGTFLRAHRDTGVHLLVAHPPGDAYKTDEVRDDPRVTLLPVEHLALDHTSAHATTPEGTRAYRPDAAFTNIGNAPTPPDGTLTTGPDGYCPPSRQHPRVLTAGDLRSPRNQRIMTAMGSGGEAALTAYYTAQDPAAGTAR